MANPLRKDEPQFETEEGITTADLAQGKRPAATTEPRGPQVVNERSTQAVPTSAPATSTASIAGQNVSPLFPSDELEGLRTRWMSIQTAFVDEPRKAVEQADSLVASAMKRLAEVFAKERSGLEQQWDRGDNVSTEDLRVALQRYRAFFDRLLSI